MNILIYIQSLPVEETNIFLSKHRLNDYLIDRHEVLKMYSGFTLDKNGNKELLKKYEAKGEEIIIDMMKNRMNVGSMIVYNPTFPNEKSFNRIMKLCKQYKYKILIVNFFNERFIKNNISKDLKRSTNKIGRLKIEEAIEEADKIQGKQNMNLIKTTPERFYNDVRLEAVDLSKYKKITHIGDIHGSINKLTKAIPYIDKSTFYIFHGDYIDKGPNNKEVLEWIYNHLNYKNIVFLKGNHEKSLYKHLNNKRITSPYYKEKTKYEVEEMQNWKMKVNKIYNSLRPMFYYKYKDIEVICSHGGIPTYTNNLYTISNIDYIYGGGSKKDTLHISDNFSNSVKDRYIYQVYGHRSNSHDDNIWISNNSFNLNGTAELDCGVLKCMSFISEDKKLKNNLPNNYHLTPHINISLLNIRE